MQTSRVPRHQRGLPTGMTDAGESQREHCVLREAGGTPSPALFLILGVPVGLQMCRLHVRPLLVNLRRVLRVGYWNVLSLSEDHRLPHLSDELRRPGSRETSSKGFTYYWSGMSNGNHVKGVGIDVSSRLLPFVVEVTPVDERIMRLRLKHS